MSGSSKDFVIRLLSSQTRRHPNWLRPALRGDGRRDEHDNELLLRLLQLPHRRDHRDALHERWVSVRLRQQRQPDDGDAGMHASMGSRGDCFDNAMAESFFATLECELLARQSFQTRNAARLALFDYIEGFYNTHRRHSALDYLSPIAYERRWTIAGRVA